MNATEFKRTLDDLRLGKTLKGRPILLNSCTADNWIRQEIYNVNYSLCFGPLKEPGLVNSAFSKSDERVSQIARCLLANLDDIRNLDGLLVDHEPQSIPPSMLPLEQHLLASLPEPEDLAPFIDSIGLPPDVTWPELYRTTGLLLIDEAVAALDRREDSFAAYMLWSASECDQYMTVAGWQTLSIEARDASLRDFLTKKGRAGGLASAETRRQQRRLDPSKIKQEYLAAVAAGVNKREIARELALRFNATADSIRRILRQQS